MRVGVVIVNYNCAPYALDAALSVLGDDPAANVVIVDNASTDCSQSYFRDAIKTRRHQPAAPETKGAQPKFPALDAISIASAETSTFEKEHPGIAIMTVEKNGGFAAGCNIGLRYLQKTADPDLFLLLNPDAVLATGSLKSFAKRLEETEAGLCGASIFRFEDPACAQALGGAAIDPLTLLGRNIGSGPVSRPGPSQEIVEAAISYPLGAAMALRKDYLDKVGYLDERFFLYYEEADWARRGAPFYRPVWAPDAVVYHRHGAAAGSRVAVSGKAPHRSPLADYHMARSRMLYALKWRPWLAPALLGGGVIQSLRRLLRGHWRQARAVIFGSMPGAPKQMA